MQTSATFWDKAARRYAERPVRDMTAYEATLERVRQHLHADDTALELGCGTGTTALLLADAVKEYTGTDISSEMIAIAREKAEADATGNVSFQVSGVTDAGTGQTYDAVLAFNLLHLIEDLPAALAHVHAQLPEGGLFISKTPCLARKKWLFKPLIVALQLVGKAPHVALLSVEGLAEMMRAAGFEIVETGDYPSTGPSRFIVARKV